MRNQNNEVNLQSEFISENSNNQNKQGLDNLDLSYVMLIKNPNNDIVIGEINTKQIPLNLL